MEVPRDTVRHMAMLARLGLEPGEMEEMGRQLGAILAYVGQLQGLDTEGVDPTFYVLGPESGSPRLRPDDPRPSLKAEDALANAPAADRGLFKVPAVIQETPEPGEGGG